MTDGTHDDLDEIAKIAEDYERKRFDDWVAKELDFEDCDSIKKSLLWKCWQASQN